MGIKRKLEMKINHALGRMIYIVSFNLCINITPQRPPNNSPHSSHMLECLPQRHCAMFHQIRNAQRCRTADARHTVHHRSAARLAHLLNHIGDLVEIVFEIDVAAIEYGHLIVQRSRIGQRCIGQLGRSIHHTCDSQLLDKTWNCNASTAQKQRGQHFGDAGQARMTCGGGCGNWVDRSVGCGGGHIGVVVGDAGVDRSVFVKRKKATCQFHCTILCINGQHTNKCINMARRRRRHPINVHISLYKHACASSSQATQKISPCQRTTRNFATSQAAPTANDATSSTSQIGTGKCHKNHCISLRRWQ